MRKKKIHDIISSIGIVTIIVYYTVRNSYAFLPWMKGLLLVGIVCGVLSSIIHLLRRDYKLRILSIIFILFTVVLGLYLRDARLFAILSVLSCSINLKMQRVVKLALVTKTLTCALVIILGGYLHINSTAMHLGMLSLLYIWGKNGRLSKLEYAGLIVWIISLIFLTKSGALVICTAFFTVMYILFLLKKTKFVLNSTFIVPMSFLLMFIFNLTGTIFINVNRFPEINSITPTPVKDVLHEASVWVDDISSYRLQLSNYSLSMFGTPAFGQKMNFKSMGNLLYFHLDSGFMWLSQEFGMIFTSMFLIIMFIIIKSAQQKKNYLFIIIAITIGLWAINEDILLDPGYNFAILYLGTLFQKEKNETE